MAYPLATPSIASNQSSSASPAWIFSASVHGLSARNTLDSLQPVIVSIARLDILRRCQLALHRRLLVTHWTRSRGSGWGSRLGRRLGRAGHGHWGLGRRRRGRCPRLEERLNACVARGTGQSSCKLIRCIGLLPVELLNPRHRSLSARSFGCLSNGVR